MITIVIILTICTTYCLVGVATILEISVFRRKKIVLRMIKTPYFTHFPSNLFDLTERRSRHKATNPKECLNSFLISQDSTCFSYITACLLTRTGVSSNMSFPKHEFVHAFCKSFSFLFLFNFAIIIWEGSAPE